MAGWLLLILGLWSAWATLVALVRVRRPRVIGFSVMVTGLAAGEWPIVQFLTQLCLAVLLVAGGALDRVVGWVGAGALGLSWIGLVAVRIVQSRARPTADEALRAGLGDDYLDQLPAERRDRLRTRPEPKVLLLPFHHDSTGIERIPDIPYGDHPTRNVLDVYRPERAGAPRPVIVQIHGGAWVTGHKRQQGMPLIHRLASNGYVAVSINYRLAPQHRFPDQLIDVKRAIAWIRGHIADHGGDPTRLILTGGSAGGHLASLAALTANDARYQPGFEQVDTSTIACMPFYGPMDFLDTAGIRGRRRLEDLLARTVMPGSAAQVPDLYRELAPLSRIHPDAPPFLVVQGTLDVLVWREESRHFADRLAAISRSPVVYWEVPGAQHAFDTLNSRRSAAAVDACERFAGWVVHRSSEGR